ncbi:MAG TPA: glycosyltransferase family protein [Rhodospirillaceae bacterium]|nr:glycosyltransferase family protein [Rhodospirillaceae bacterium]
MADDDSGHPLAQSAIEQIGRRDFAAALASCDRLTEAGATAEAIYLRGIIFLSQADNQASLPLLRDAQQIMPDRADIAYNLGVALRGAGRLEEAADMWRQVTSRAPDHLDAWRNLCRAVDETAGERQTLGTYRAALCLHPSDRILLFNFANSCHRQGRSTEAVDLHSRLLKTYPTFADGWTNAGLALKSAGMMEAAEQCTRQAIQLSDSALAHFNLGLLLLAQGRFAEGFAEYAWRHRLPDAPPPPWPAPFWSAALPAGSRVLLWSDQGAGDAIQFLRLARTLVDRGYQTLVFVQSGLKDLAATAPGVAGVVTPADPPRLVDAHLPMSAAPHLLGLDHAGALSPPYLASGKPPALPSPPRQARARIGLVWAGNPEHANDRNRSMRLVDLAPLFSLPKIAWYSLQLGKGAEDLAASPWKGRVSDLSPLLRDWSATAALIGQLDLLISVDTAVAHLAGALGRPAWVLLPKGNTDWRWGIDTATSEWYPSLRLFRQMHPGDWRTVVEAVAIAIRCGAVGVKFPGANGPDSEARHLSVRSTGSPTN